MATATTGRQSLLIVGQAPSRAMAPGDRPFEGTRALTLLAKYAGVSPRERLYELADFKNLIEDYPGAQIGNEKYDYFPEVEARQMVPIFKMVVKMQPYDRVVLLGSAVSKCFGKKQTDPWFQSVQITDSAEWYYAPHPGGTSMWWNRPENRQAGTRFFTWLFQQQDTSRRTVDGLSAGSDRRTPDFGRA